MEIRKQKRIWELYHQPTGIDVLITVLYISRHESFKLAISHIGTSLVQTTQV